MNTEKEKEWLFITVAKPLRWTFVLIVLLFYRKKNIQVAKREGKKHSKQTSPTELPPVRSKSPSKSTGMQKTLVTKFSVI